MLAYFDTSGHDDQTLREIYGRKPAPEYLEWAINQGIFAHDTFGSIVRGPHWSDPRRFCDSEAEFRELLEATPATYGLDAAGPRPANRVSRDLLLNQSFAREASRAELRIEDLVRITPLRVLNTQATSKDAHLNSPKLGSRLDERSLNQLSPENKQVQVVISDGLSAEAVHHNLQHLLPILLEGFVGRGVNVGVPLLVRYGRVKLAEPIAEKLETDLVVHLIGERPGGDALASRSLSAYLVYRLADPSVQVEAARFSGNPEIRFEYTVISNIYSAGLPPAEAAAVIVEKACEILRQRAAGNRLEALLRRAES
jgi:ethanolamine ammonia-lyase large subunit